MSEKTFDPAGSLPSGPLVAVLESSAGTGKTYAIAGLVTRFVAEGYARLPELLVVTFTRAAAAELRDRIRRRLVATSERLEGVLAGDATADAEDAVTALLASGPPVELAARVRRLGAGLAELDAASITTIHGFCQQALRATGLSVGADREAELIADQRQLVATAVEDLLVRRYHADEQAAEHAPGRAEASALAQVVAGSPDALLVPEAPTLPASAERLALALALRIEVTRRKRAARLTSYDDLLTGLAAALEDPAAGADVRRRLRAQYRAVLVDEFQDTDPVQWRILEQAFAHGPDGRPLVLIGDPKQAIYAFRGADVRAYLAARSREGAALRRLVTNWRSDAGLLRGLHALLDGATFGDPDIAYQQVEPAPAHAAPRLVGPDVGAPVRLRMVQRDGDVRLYKGKVRVASGRQRVADDLACELVALLDGGGEIVERDAHTEASRSRAVVPADVAVLVRTHREAALVQGVLLSSGVPAVVNGVGSVLATPAADAWLRLLRALDRPSNPGLVRSAVLTPFLGWTGDRLAEAADDDLEDVRRTLHSWGGVLRGRSVASLIRVIADETGLHQRVLVARGGERLLTDVQHVGELLHAAAMQEGLGVASLVGWLAERIAGAADDDDAGERARRLESDADAVQIVTVHGSKGLEYPIVYCPYLWNAGIQRSDVPVVHDRDRPGVRVVDVGVRSEPGLSDHQSDARADALGEALRLCYVALTRARHQVVLWWVPTGPSKESALARLLFCRHDDGSLNLRCTTGPVPTDAKAVQRLATLVGAGGGELAVEVVGPRPAARWRRAEAAAPEELRLAHLDRAVDRSWRRTSYSALVASAPHQPAGGHLIGAEPDIAVTDDEELAAAPPGADRDAREGVGEEPAASERTPAPLPLGGLAGGTAFGTLVHEVLEHADFAADDPQAELAGVLRRRPDAVEDEATLVTGLVAALSTPLGPLAGERCLADVPRRDRLDELRFELPLAGGLDPRGAVALGAIAELLRAHLPADDPLAGYPDVLASLRAAPTVRGFLNGSIDVVLRLDGRYLVVDYKTNRLAAPGREPTPADYRPAALARAMERGHYPLQALLYEVALHRYLRGRLPAYDPATHLGGVLYLFLRGMTGAQVPRVAGAPHGVLAWRPPAVLVTALSDLLDGRAAP